MTNRDRTTIRAGFGLTIAGIGKVIHSLDGGIFFIIIGYILIFVAITGWWLPKEDVNDHQTIQS